MKNPGDQAWAQAARDSRAALALLGRPIDPRCLPDETEPCGATFAMHAAAHLASIKAVCDHQLGHLGLAFAELFSEVYWQVRDDLAGYHDDDPEGNPDL